MDHVGAYGSYLPFELEWKKLQDADALERVGRSKLVAMKSSNIEYFIPRAFAVLFSGVLIAVIAVTVFDWPPTKLVPSPCPKPTASSGVPIP